MATLILAGQDLQAGTDPGKLGQYYGSADTAQTTVLAASFANLSSVYTIPGGEAYTGAAYELECAGFGVQGSTVQAMSFQMATNGSLFGPAITIGATSWNTSEAFGYYLKMKLVSADGVQNWWCSMSGAVGETPNNIIPGSTGANTYAIAAANTGPRIATVAAPVTVAIQFKWASATGAPTITNTLTTFRKTA